MFKVGDIVTGNEKSRVEYKNNVYSPVLFTKSKVMVVYNDCTCSIETKCKMCDKSSIRVENYSQKFCSVHFVSLNREEKLRRILDV